MNRSRSLTSRCLLALAALLVPAAAPALHADLDTKLDSRLTEEPEVLMTLVAPDRRWRVLTASELGALAPDGLAGLAGPGSVRCVLRTETSLRTDLEEIVHEKLEALRLSLVNPGFIESGDVGGRPAAHGLITGKRDGVWWRYHVLVFRVSDQLISLTSRGKSEEVPTDGSAFLGAAEGLRLLTHGESGDNSAVRRLPDDQGIGWRLREGVFEDAALGFRIEPRGPWRVALRDELKHTMGPDFRVGMADVQHEAWFAVVVEHVPGINKADHMAQRTQEASEFGHASGSRKAELTNQVIELQMLTLPAFSGKPSDTEHMVHGVMFKGDHCLQVFARYPANVEASMVAPLREALSSVTWMPEPERVALAEELAAKPSFPDAVGDMWIQRGGMYTDFRTGFRWRPAGKFWEIEAEPGRDPTGDGIQLAIRERGLGVRGWLATTKLLRATRAEEYHAEELDLLFGDRRMREITEAVPFRFGDVEGLTSWCTPDDTMLPVRYLLATAVTPRRAYMVLLDSTPEAMVRGADEVLAGLGTLEISNRTMPRSEVRKGTYRDFRLGFELTSPDPNWLFEDRAVDHFGPAALPAEGVVVGFQGPGRNGMFACAVWSSVMPDGPDGPVETLLPGALSDLARLPAGTPDEDVVAKFRGRPGRLLSWREGDRTVEVMLMIERGTLFAVGASSRPEDPEPRKRLAGFRILE